MSKHTPEPWFHHSPSGSHHTAGGYINASQDRDDGYICAVYGSGRPCDIVKANALRIVSCVNACDGMEDPEKEIAELRKQRDTMKVRINELLSERNAAGVAIDNAVRGILPDANPILNRLQMIAKIAKQRDKLLAALESLADVASSCDGWESFPRCALDAANSAIAEESK